jgi:hypothetical protein
VVNSGLAPPEAADHAVHDNARGRLLAALARQDALWLRMRADASHKSIPFSDGELDG